MPLFQVLSYPEVHLFRMELVTVIDFVSWDAGSAHPGSSPQPVMTFAGAPQRPSSAQSLSGGLSRLMRWLQARTRTIPSTASRS